jgi:hypothetical protein
LNLAHENSHHSGPTLAGTLVSVVVKYPDLTEEDWKRFRWLNTRDFRVLNLAFATSKRNCLEPHIASVLHTEMSEAANPPHRDDVTGTRSGLAQGIN